MGQKRAKHNEGIPKHIPRTYRNHRTTIRVFPDEWQTFKETCHQYGLTTCYVLRSFIHQWLEALRRDKRHTEMENAQRLDRILRDTYNHMLEEKGERWIYCKRSMTLYDPRSLRGRIMSKSRGTLNL